MAAGGEGKLRQGRVGRHAMVVAQPSKAAQSMRRQPVGGGQPKAVAIPIFFFKKKKIVNCHNLRWLFP